jgi:hypothetical protein
MPTDLHFLTIAEAASLIATRELSQFSPQIAGRLFDEQTVPRAGDAYESATPWRARGPTLVTRAES